MENSGTAGETGEDSRLALGEEVREVHSILQKESFRSIAKLLCETAGKLIGADASYAAIVNPAGGKPEISVWDPASQKYTVNSALPPRIADLSRDMHRSPKPFYQNDLPARPGRELPGAGGRAYESLMTIPLVLDNCSLGFIWLTNKPGGFAGEDVKMAEDLSRLAAVAIAKNISLEMFSSRERQYRDLFEHAGEPIVVNDLRGVFLDVNGKACEMLGYSKSELLGKNAREILHPAHAAELGSLLGEVRSKGETVFEAACLRKDGSLVDLELSSRLFDYYGHRAVLTLGSDISARKRSADSMTHEKERLERLWNIYQHQAKSVKELLDYVLEEAVRLTGSRAGSVCRHYYDTFKKSFVLETWGRDMDREVCVISKPPAPAPRKTGIWGKALTSRKPVLLHGAEVPPDKTADFLEQTTENVQCLAVPAFISEKNAAVIGLTRKTGHYTDSDAREVSLMVDSVLELVRRKRSEEELAKNRVILSAILNSTPDAILTKDLSGRYTSLNLCAAALMRKKVEDVLGRRDTELFPPKLARRLRERDKRILEGRKLVTFEEKIGASDTGRTFLVTSGPLFSDTGRCMGVVSIARDISERKKMETELITAQKTESLSVMAAGIAHDFNNMLTAVLGNTSLALEGLPAKGQIFRLLTNTLKAARSAQELTHQLQTFARGDEGLPKHVLDLRRVIKEATTLAGCGARTKFVFDLNPDTPPVKGNEGQLKQVINNLALNATQAMAREGTVTIKTAAVNIQEEIAPNLKPGAYVRITVADTGPGIAEENVGRIFDPYFSTKKKGRGLGLSMVASITKNHGGHIGVVSKEGEGTIFVIYLPAAGRRVAPETREKKPAKAAKGRILVMDDDRLVLEVLTLMLQRLGYATETAEDGWAAITAYNKAAHDKRPFSAVILDLTIPGSMGGDEAAKRLRAIDPAVKLVLSSGYANTMALANCAEHGFDTVLPKPYQIKEVGAVMAKLLKKPGGKTAARTR